MSALSVCLPVTTSKASSSANYKRTDLYLMSLYERFLVLNLKRKGYRETAGCTKTTGSVVCADWK